jgi:hypothetical protein
MEEVVGLDLRPMYSCYLITSFEICARRQTTALTFQSNFQIVGLIDIVKLKALRLGETCHRYRVGDSCCMFHVRFSLGALLNTEDEGGMLFRKVI